MSKEEKISSLVAFFLGIIFLICSFFLVYANEISLDKNAPKTRYEAQNYYSKFFLWEYLKKTADYKNSVLESENDSKSLINWVVRIIGIFGIWFAFSLFSIQIFKDSSKDMLVRKSFLYAFFLVLAMIIFLKVYIFYLNWGFNINLNFSWLSEKSHNSFSFSEQFLIIFIILTVFILVWMLYNYKLKKAEENRED